MVTPSQYPKFQHYSIIFEGWPDTGIDGKVIETAKCLYTTPDKFDSLSNFVIQV